MLNNTAFKIATLSIGGIFAYFGGKKILAILDSDTHIIIHPGTDNPKKTKLSPAQGAKIIYVSDWAKSSKK